MAKVKFNLNYNGKQIRSIEELRENFAASVVEIIADYRSGLLERWLEARWFDDEREKVLAIKSADDCEILAELMEIFGVEPDSNFISDAEKNPDAAALVRGVVEIFERGEWEAKERRKRQEQEKHEREERERHEREEQERRRREEQERREREEQERRRREEQECREREEQERRECEKLERREREEQEKQVRVEKGKKLLAQKSFWILCCDGSSEDVKCAIQAGANVNAKNYVGMTALMCAAMNTMNNTADVVNVVNALIQAGADINAKNYFGMTALMLAARYNTADVVNALIQAGADVNAKNYFGGTAFALSRKNKKLKNTDALKRLEDMTIYKY